MGLQTIVREELKLRKLTWDRKSKQAQPNKKAAASLARRQRGFVQNSPAGHQRQMPGSYSK
jgi:hypothetical protein